ncbi:MAG: ribosome-associated translation inhibitor RaiA [Phycisphaerae bacterium]|nr:ribosome-associated translation inhibitor RaiA [Phycisphaerae bacterium]
MNITIEARHMDVTDAIRQYAESKVEKLPKYYDNIQSIEVILDMDGGQPSVEIIVQASRKNTFVAHYRDADLYAGIDGCVDKVSQQLRRHKDKVRDRQGPPHSEMS